MLTRYPVSSLNLMGILPEPRSKYLNAWSVLSQGLCFRRGVKVSILKPSLSAPPLNLVV